MCYDGANYELKALQSDITSEIQTIVNQNVKVRNYKWNHREKHGIFQSRSSDVRAIR